MKLPLLLALLCGTVSPFHLRPETFKFESSLGDKTLSQNEEMAEVETEKAPMGELELQEVEEEIGSASEDFPGEEEPTESAASALTEVDKGFQCPKEEDTVKMVGIPGYKTGHLLLVRSASNFDHAQATCRMCYGGNLVSIHNYNCDYQIQSWFTGFNQGQVWIGGRITGWGLFKSFYWLDGSFWNFAYWATGQPWSSTGHCVALCTHGGYWQLAHCGLQLPFICSY